MSDLNYLLDTTDAMVWAEAFCKQFEGERVAPTEDWGVVTPGLMVAWFANAMAAQEMKDNGPLVEAFLKQWREENE